MTLPGWVGVREPRGRLGGRYAKNVTICPTQACTHCTTPTLLRENAVAGAWGLWAPRGEFNTEKNKGGESSQCVVPHNSVLKLSAIKGAGFQSPNKTHTQSRLRRTAACSKAKSRVRAAVPRRSRREPSMLPPVERRLDSSATCPFSFASTCRHVLVQPTTTARRPMLQCRQQRHRSATTRSCQADR